MATQTTYTVFGYYCGCRTLCYTTSSLWRAVQRAGKLQEDRFTIEVNKVVTTSEDVTESVRESLRKQRDLKEETK